MRRVRGKWSGVAHASEFSCSRTTETHPACRFKIKFRSRVRVAGRCIKLFAVTCGTRGTVCASGASRCIQLTYSLTTVPRPVDESSTTIAPHINDRCV